MRVGIASDHGGFNLKAQLIQSLKSAEFEAVDFCAREFNPDDDYPDFVIPLAQAVANTEVDRGIAICGSGVGACFCANKVSGIRAALIADSFSAHQGVEDDNMNMMCLGGLVTGEALAWDLVQIFLRTHFKGSDRFKRRLLKVSEFEKENKGR